MDETGREVFSNVRQLTRNWIVPGVAAAVFVLGYISFRVGRMDDSAWEPLGAIAMWIGGWVAALTWLRNAFPRERAATLVASRTSFVVNGEAPIAVEDIQESRVIPKAIRHARDVVELTIRSRRERIRLALMPQDAARFLALVSAGAGERRASFRLMIAFSSRFYIVATVLGVPWEIFTLARIWGPDVAGVVLLGALGLFYVAGLCAVIAIFLGVLLRGRVVIGAEGFTTNWYGWRRFRSFDTVKDVDLRQHGKLIDTVILSNQNERPRRLIARDTPDTDAQTGAEGRGLAITMKEAFERWTRMPNVAKTSAQLERGPRSAKEWLAGIDHLVRGGQASYRVASVTPEILVAVVRGSDASTEAKVGAAAALLRVDNAAHRATVRIAAEACAEPKTRQALLDLVAAEENNAEMEAALERVRHVR